jgi:prepilin-type N-terminal cleavage/methylation domain-containing protein
MSVNDSRNSAYRQKGFTLIELIVVFTVIAILSTIGTVSFVGYSRTQTLNQATSDLVQSLNLAKSLSASQLKTLDKNNSGPEGCLEGQILNGYGVQINVDSYNLYIQCLAGNGTKMQPVTDAKWKTELPNGVTISLATSINVFFPVLSGGIIATGGNSVVLRSVYSGISQKTINFSNGYISVSP